MITLAVLLSVIAIAAVFILLCVITGGITGLAIAGDVVIAVFIICFLIKILIKK